MNERVLAFQKPFTLIQELVPDGTPAAGWTGSLGEPAAKQRLAACIRDSSLPARDLVTQYLPGMFSDHPSPEIRDRLAAIISDTHPAGFSSHGNRSG